MNSTQKKRLEHIEAAIRPHSWERYEHLTVSKWPDAALTDFIQSMPECERHALMREAGWTDKCIEAHGQDVSRKART